MQQVGRERIHRTFTDGTLTLHELVSGNYVWAGEDATRIVESVEEVQSFPANVRQLVSDWLALGGVNRAKKEKREILMAEQASKQQGTLDAMIDQLHDPELKGQIVEMLRDMIEQRAGKTAGDPRPVVAATEVGVIKANADGTREFVPSDIEMEQILAREEAFSQGAPEGHDLVPVGVGAEANDSGESIHDDIRAATHAATKQAVRQSSGKGGRKR